MRENKCLEFKQDITNTFLKTVSAYANYAGGEIKRHNWLLIYTYSIVFVYKCC